MIKMVQKIFYLILAVNLSSVCFATAAKSALRRSLRAVPPLLNQGKQSFSTTYHRPHRKPNLSNNPTKILPLWVGGSVVGASAIYYAIDRDRKTRFFFDDICSAYLPIRHHLDKGLDPNCRNSAGETALAYAGKYSSLDNFKMLLDAGADPDLLSDGLTVLETLIYHLYNLKKEGSDFQPVHLKKLEILIKLHKNNAEKAKTPLVVHPNFKEAPLIGLIPDAIYLNPDDRIIQAMHSALQAAVEGENAFVVKALVDNNAKVFKLPFPKRGERHDAILSFLSIAALRGNLEIVKILFPYYDAQSYDDTFQDSGAEKTNYALALASKEGHEEVVNFFISHGVPPNSPRLAFGINPLESAIKSRKTEIVKILLKAGADPNHRSGSPLFEAVECDCVFSVRMLLESGAKVTHRAILKAIGSMNKPILDLLVDYNDPSKSGMTLVKNHDGSYIITILEKVVDEL